VSEDCSERLPSARHTINRGVTWGYAAPPCANFPFSSTPPPSPVLGTHSPWVYTRLVADFLYPWQQTVLEAFVAPPNSLAVKIGIAERAIATRLVDTGLGEDERLVIKDALQALRVLLRETTAYRNEEIPNEDIA